MSDTAPTSDGALTMVTPVNTAYAPDAAEAGLVALYRHQANTVRLGMIESRDGKAAGPDGSSRSLNGPEDLRILLTLRSQADVVVVGANTARLERYGPIVLPQALQDGRKASGMRPHVDLAVVTHSGNIPAALDPADTWVVTTVGSPAAQRLSEAWRHRIIYAGAHEVSPPELTSELERRGLTRVLCEGGPQLARAFLSHGIVDDYCLTTSSRPGGQEEPKTPPVPDGFTPVHELVGGGFTMRRWRRS